MRYKINPNVVCTEICGKYLLMAARNLWDRLPYVQEINRQAYFCWRLLEETRDSEKMKTMAAEEYGISLNEAGEAVTDFLKLLEEKGYIMEESSNTTAVSYREPEEGSNQNTKI